MVFRYQSTPTGISNYIVEDDHSLELQLELPHRYRWRSLFGVLLPDPQPVRRVLIAFHEQLKTSLLKFLVLCIHSVKRSAVYLRRKPDPMKPSAQVGVSRLNPFLGARFRPVDSVIVEGGSGQLNDIRRWHDVQAEFPINQGRSGLAKVALQIGLAFLKSSLLGLLFSQ